MKMYHKLSEMAIFMPFGYDLGTDLGKMVLPKSGGKFASFFKNVGNAM